MDVLIIHMTNYYKYYRFE